MGTFGSRFQDSSQGPEEVVEGAGISHKHGCDCKKRKRSAHCDCDSEPEEEDSLLDTPRRKKLKSTSKYIYQTLFLNGENSDIRICALGQEWNLHKVYLCQSGYFSSMFSGSWKESNMMVIELEIPDQNIDTEALQVVFGSLYRDDVLIKPSRVVSILAAACMLQLDGLIQQCGETMKENVNVKTVCGYYSSASIYGLDSVMKKCLEWLLNNLMTHQNVDLMKELGVEVMEQLIQSSDLFVMQVEMDVYTALKKWMFLQMNPSWDGPIKQLLADADSCLCKRRTELAEEEPFLKTEEGSLFVPVFKHVRLQYIINDLASARILERDNILPPEWLTYVYKNQWFAMLRTEHDNDNGPQEANKEEFEVNSMRCGRKLSKDGDYCWRWTGFNFGFDLLVTYTNRFIVFKRNTLSQPCGGAVSLQPRRHLAYRLRLASFDSSGKLVCSRSTGYQLLTLEKDQEYVVMNLDSRLLSFPLYVCCNFLYTSTQSDRRPNSPEPECSARSVL
ncbi:germ cell-less protein-like 1 [Hypomesus transpacificus]|uniref:germ cell-less protein-like 1 n=1 Tax=Hypomesus transpacificus TaxID=137520 RepID=UPI001F083B8B|nr:germ cell-less protein-like 1 [Hypomesus transpacificus]XP_046900369.1 germ cell-less protein-like 1 [Hypomesus transpacificus]XP_046900370.1 germ cell-less protein-like 1 [Hypomesus transpacificus]XP_046900371.1 germ cell-less protein-like 1 [Hypomesus transpacificus]